MGSPAAAFDETRHPRLPGGHGGGQFTHGPGGEPQQAKDPVGHSIAAFKTGTAYPPAPSLPAGLHMGPGKQCYANTATAMFEHGLGYAEGYGWNPRISLWIHHAWNTDKQGRAVDLTWPTEPGLRYVGHPYTAGQVLDRAAARGYYDAMDGNLTTLLTAEMAGQPAPEGGTAMASKDSKDAFKVVSPHPDCPPAKPHATVDNTTGVVMECHPTKQMAQDMALHMNLPDVTGPGGGPATLDIGAAAIEDDPDFISAKGNAETLKAFWTTGKGAALIRWNTPGDWQRCVDHLGKYMADPKGYCVTGSTRVLPAGIVMAAGQVPAAGTNGPAAAAQAGPLRYFAGGKLRSSYERHYVGDVIIIRTAGGYELTVTPNHPVATPGGWVPAAELKVGGDVLCSRSAERRMGAVGDDENNVVPAIKQVAKALPLTFTTVTWPVDFHGDGPGSQVHVVRADSLLMSDLGAALGEQPGELLLISGDHGTRLARAGGLERSGPATTRSPVRLGDGGRGRIPGGTSQCNPGFGEYLIDPPNGDPGISGDGNDGFTAQIAAFDINRCETRRGALIGAGTYPAGMQDVTDLADRAAERGSDHRGSFPGPEPSHDIGFVDLQAPDVGDVPDGDAVAVQHLGDRLTASTESCRDILDLHPASVVHADDGLVIEGAAADEPAGLARAGTTADLDPALAEKLLDTGRTDPQAASDFREWLAADVTPRQVVSIQRGSFDGHVYDLGTNTGVFTGETILCGPCELRHQEATGMSTSEHAALIKGHKAAAAEPDSADVEARFDPGELRDNLGRWGTGGGSVELGGHDKKTALRALREASGEPGAGALAKKLASSGKTHLSPEEQALLKRVLLKFTGPAGKHVSKDEARGLANLFGQPGKGGKPRKPATGPAGQHVSRREAEGLAQMFADAAPALPALITIPGVDILAAGTWALSTGRQTFTRADLQAAADAAACPAVGPPVIKIGHLDDRFTPEPHHDGEPAIGKVTNLRADASGNKLIGDMAGMPGWLGAVAASAFPRRSVEGTYNFPCQIGHVHPFVITAVALLGVTPPGVGVLGGLDDIAALYGLSSTAAAGGWHTPPADQEGTVMAVTEEDVRRAYYAAGGAPPSWWITELQMDPTQLIVADEQSQKVYRVPFTISGSGVEFGDPQEFATYSDVAAARGTGPLVVFASAAESRAVTVQATWDAAAAQANLGDDPAPAQIKALYALPGDTKTASSLPHHDVAPGGKVGAANPQGCSAAIGALNGSRGGVKGVTPDAKKTAYAHLAAHLKAAGQTPPDLKAAAGARLDRLKAIRAAAGDTDSDENVNQLVASLDATLDQASDLSSGVDRTKVDAATGQALDLITAAEAIADQLMELLGIPDPDDLAAAAAGENVADWPVDDQTGEDVEAAGTGHAACDATHTHPHPAMGSQGGDQTHTHEHSHSGDAVHDHAHAPAAASGPADERNRREMEFSPEQLGAIRAKLGKPDDYEVTAADIAATFTNAATVTASAAGGDDLPQITDGTYLVDGEILRGYQTRAAAGDAAANRLRINERDQILAEAVRVGKFSRARLPHFETLWDSDPEGARRVVDALAAGLVPMNGAVGTPGNDPDMPGVDFDDTQAYATLYPEDVAAARQRRAEQAARGAHA